MTRGRTTTEYELIDTGVFNQGNAQIREIRHVHDYRHCISGYDHGC